MVAWTSSRSQQAENCKHVIQSVWIIMHVSHHRGNVKKGYTTHSFTSMKHGLLVYENRSRSRTCKYVPSLAVPSLQPGRLTIVVTK